MMMTDCKVLARFVTTMRAASLVQDLSGVGVEACTVQPKWTNRTLPPPPVEVMVASADFDKALDYFNNDFSGKGAM